MKNSTNKKLRLLSLAPLFHQAPRRSSTDERNFSFILARDVWWIIDCGRASRNLVSDYRRAAFNRNILRLTCQQASGLWAQCRRWWWDDCSFHRTRCTFNLSSHLFRRREFWKRDKCHSKCTHNDAERNEPMFKASHFRFCFSCQRLMAEDENKSSSQLLEMNFQLHNFRDESLDLETLFSLQNFSSISCRSSWTVRTSTTTQPHRWPAIRRRRWWSMTLLPSPLRCSITSARRWRCDRF